MSDQTERGEVIFRVTKAVKDKLDAEIKLLASEGYKHLDLELFMSVIISLTGSLVAQLCINNEPDVELKDALDHPKAQFVLKSIAVRLLTMDYQNAQKVMVEQDEVVA